MNWKIVKAPASISTGDYDAECLGIRETVELDFHNEESGYGDNEDEARMRGECENDHDIDEIIT